MDWLARIGNAIWGKLEPKLDTRLDNFEKLAKTEIDELQAIAKQELDEWQVIAREELAQWREDAMKMLADALPEMAGEIAKQTVLTTFEHTQADEAVDAVSNIITGIVNRIPGLDFKR